MLLTLPIKLLRQLKLDTMFALKRGVSQYYKSQYANYKAKFLTYLFGGSFLMLVSVFGSSVYISTILPLGMDAVSFVTDSFTKQNIITVSNALFAGAIGAVILEVVTFGAGVNFLSELKKHKRFRDNFMVFAYFVVFIISATVEIATFNQSTKLIYTSSVFDKSLKELKAEYQTEFRDINIQYKTLEAKLREAEKGNVLKADMIVSKPNQEELNIARERATEAKKERDRAFEAWNGKYGKLSPTKYKTLRAKTYSSMVKPLDIKLDETNAYLSNILSHKRVLTLQGYKDYLKNEIEAVKGAKEAKQLDLANIQNRINEEFKRVNSKYNNMIGYILGLTVLLFQIYTTIVKEKNEEEMLKTFDNAGKRIKGKETEKENISSEKNSSSILDEDFLNEMNKILEENEQKSELSEPRTKNSRKDSLYGDGLNIELSEPNEPNNYYEPSEDIKNYELSRNNEPSELSKIIKFYLMNERLPSNNELAAILDISDRQVKRIKKQLKEDGYYINPTKTTTEPTIKFLELVKKTREAA